MSVMTMLATERGDNVNDYTKRDIKGYTFIDTAGHGYLCLGSDDNGYSDALEIARASNYSYILDGGLVFLEEDCDATKFLNTGITNFADSPVGDN
jgi:hypothetical protein